MKKYLKNKNKIVLKTREKLKKLNEFILLNFTI